MRLIPIVPDLDITNYADDNTPHSTNINLNKVLHDLEKNSNTLFKWFTNNLLKADPEKSDLLTNSAQEIQINIGGMAISNSKSAKLLGIHIDNKLTFEPHVRCLCKKASHKLNSFARIACSLKSDQRKLLPNAFITSQRALRIVYQDHNSTFEELLEKNGSFKIHDSNLQRLLIEMFKVKMKLAPEIMNEVFDIIESQYPLRNELRFKSRNICTVRYGT